MKWGQSIWLQKQICQSEEIQPTDIAAIQYKSDIKDTNGKGLEVLWQPSRIHPMVVSYNVQRTESDSRLSINPLVAEEINDHWKRTVYMLYCM